MDKHGTVVDDGACEDDRTFEDILLSCGIETGRPELGQPPDCPAYWPEELSGQNDAPMGADVRAQEARRWNEERGITPGMSGAEILQKAREFAAPKPRPIGLSRIASLHCALDGNLPAKNAEKRVFILAASAPADFYWQVKWDADRLAAAADMSVDRCRAALVRMSRNSKCFIAVQRRDRRLCIKLRAVPRNWITDSWGEPDWEMKLRSGLAKRPKLKKHADQLVAVRAAIYKTPRLFIWAARRAFIALEMGRLTGIELAGYLVIAHDVGRNTTRRTKYADLGTRLGLSGKQAKRVVRALADKGFIGNARWHDKWGGSEGVELSLSDVPAFTSEQSTAQLVEVTTGVPAGGDRIEPIIQHTALTRPDPTVLTPSEPTVLTPTVLTPSTYARAP